MLSKKVKWMGRLAVLGVMAMSLSKVATAMPPRECIEFVCWCEEAVQVCRGGDCRWYCTKKVCEGFRIC